MQMDSYDLLPELKLMFSDLIKPELDALLLFYRDDKVWIRYQFTESSRIDAIEDDLCCFWNPVEDAPSFKTDYTLEHNANQILGLNNMSLLVAIGDAFTQIGVDELLE
jgi:hypothetical protein